MKYDSTEEDDSLGLILPSDIPVEREYFNSSFIEFINKKSVWSTLNWDLKNESLTDFENLTSKEKNRINSSIIDFWEKGLSCMSNNSVSFYSFLENLEFVRSKIFDDIGVEKNYIKLLEDEGFFEPKKLSTLGTIVFEKMFVRSIIKGIKPLIDSIKSIENLSSIRANSDRLYSNHSDIFGINELLREFSKIRLNPNSKVKKFLVENLQRFGLGDDILIKRTQGIASEVFVVKNNKEILLADLGFGYTQLLPILLKIIIISQNERLINPIWEERNSSILLLEEPESNLHPSYQSKLAELIIEAAELFNIQFIIETHSEYFIRNLQYLTAIKKIKPRDTKIYYFHQPGSEDFKEAPYRVIEIGEDGRLSNEFGEGFFDEIPRLLAFLYNSNFN